MWVHLMYSSSRKDANKITCLWPDGGLQHCETETEWTRKTQYIQNRSENMIHLFHGKTGCLDR